MGTFPNESRVLWLQTRYIHTDTTVKTYVYRDCLEWVKVVCTSVLEWVEVVCTFLILMSVLTLLRRRLWYVYRDLFGFWRILDHTQDEYWYCRCWGDVYITFTGGEWLEVISSLHVYIYKLNLNKLSQWSWYGAEARAHHKGWSCKYDQSRLFVVLIYNLLIRMTRILLVC